MFDLAAVTLLSTALNTKPVDKPYGPETQPVPAAAERDPQGPLANQPGLIRPADSITGWKKHDDDHRGFACIDNDCKTRTPVYNTQTPLEQEQGRIDGR
ncbi:MAG: hypothetical protein JF615_06895 [Asticcacaulis sp.]|nr:hypothetical protein [Asticcacaulis sp.]